MATVFKGQSPHYVPTLEQIAAACAEIQATWTPFERELRKHGYSLNGPTIRTRQTNRKRGA